MASRGAPFRAVTESARERETYRYSTSLLSTAVLNLKGRVLPAGKLTAPEDTALTAFAQLGACQTGTSRSLISLFDQNYQYIIAEATPTLPLVSNLSAEQRNEDLYHCGTAIPRSHGGCEYTLYDPEPSEFAPTRDPTELPLTMVHDIGADPRYNTRVYCQPGAALFYAAVPIRTNKGINIGVYCVVDSEPHDDWGDQQTEKIRNISRAIMQYLEVNKARANHRRSERMNRGIGSFIEEKATMSGWRLGPHAAAFKDQAKLEGALNAKQQERQHEKEKRAHRSPHNVSLAPSVSPTLPQSAPVDNKLSMKKPTIARSHSTGCCANATAQVTTAHENPRQSARDLIFSRAANLIRESIEVEGCLFLDAPAGPFGAMSTPVVPDHKVAPGHYSSDHGEMSSSGSGNSSDESKASSCQEATPTCRVLSFSTSEKSSINGEPNSALHATVPQKFLATLLRRYPRGKIFFFGENGELPSGESSDEDDTEMVSDNDDATNTQPPPDSLDADQNGTRKKRRKNRWAPHREGQVLLNIFPGARSVAFVPVWDPRRNRWFAGGFVYTNTPIRIFMNDQDLSYLRAFGTLAMAESARHDIILDEKAKSDALSSLSHELRSPLHGIILGVELLNDTDLSVVQGDIAHTLETCGRTLNDTLDHLLDFSKINNVLEARKQQKTAPSRGLRRSAAKAIEARATIRSPVVRLDRLAEEVVESVFAGYNFQQLSISQFKNHGRGAHPDVTANRRMDQVRAEEVLGPAKTASGNLQITFGDVSIFLMVDPSCNWAFHAQPGAFRRIVMNLFGNALKYTKRGIIRIALSQSPSSQNAQRGERLVNITVSDTGRGISKDFLQNELFKPFSQENYLAPGTGLGLSLVKKMTSQLGGHVSVRSRCGVGTTVNISLPLMQASPSQGDPSSEDHGLLQPVNGLRGLRVCLLGFNDDSLDHEALDADDVHPNSNALIEGMCREWLQMEVVSASLCETMAPDLILLADGALPVLHHSPTLSKLPCVVVCANALVAYKRMTTSKQTDPSECIEFISQPIGPCKLAKTLLLVFQRWTQEQTIGSVNETSCHRSEFPCEVASRPITIPQPLGTSESPSCNGQSTTPSSSSKSLSHSSPARIAAQPQRKRRRLSGGLSTDGTKTQYLVVDDNPVNLKILSSYLKRLEQVYRTATNGLEAVKVYKQDPEGCSVIFLDVSMPVMDGFRASREIRAYEREMGLEPAFIVALTGLASADAQLEAFGSGMDMFLTKPVQLKELEAILQSQGVVL